MTHKAESESYMAQFIDLKGLREEYTKWLAVGPESKSADPIFEALCRSRTFLEWLDDGTNEGVNDLLKIIKEGIAQREKEPQFTGPPKS